MKKKWLVTRKISGFTLLEVIIAITSFFLILAAIIGIYGRMIKLKYNIQARTNVTQDAYFVIEKINLLLKDYTIDYEEYFNRKNVGCDSYTEPFTRNDTGNGYCDLFTAYGNNNEINGESMEHKTYLCSSVTNRDIPYKVIRSSNVVDGSWCVSSWRQSFGQYRRQFRDVKKNVDTVEGERNDDDDENIMKWPAAIEDGENVQELYLISQDGTSRIFLRRKLLETGDFNNDGIYGSGDSEKRYTLQMLKLKGFDAGSNHDFNTENSSGVYDGKIDTRVCDYSQGFICWWSGISDIYSGYKFPQDVDDGRVNLFQKNITISDRNIRISPNRNPQYALAQPESQINPYFTIYFTSKLYGEIWQKRLGMQTIDNYQTSLQTTFNTKNFYTK